MRKKDLKFNMILFAAVMIISAVFMATHEGFRDDSQAWLIARDTTLTGLFEILPYEGHPAIWYLILKPFAKAGFPYCTVRVIAYVFSSAAVWMLIFKSPFSRMMRAIIALSPLMVYYYPCFGRPYSLIILILFLLAYLYRYRKERPILYNVLILALFNTHTYFCLFCSGLLLLQFIEIIADLRKKKNVSKYRWIGLLIGFAGGLLLVAQLYNCFNLNGDIELKKNPENGEYYQKPFFKNIGTTMSFLLYNLQYWDVRFVYSHIFIVVCLIITLSIVRYPKQLLLFICGFHFILVFTIFFYASDAGTKIFMLYITMIYTCWIMYYEKRSFRKRKKAFISTGNRIKDFIKKRNEISPIEFLSSIIIILIIIAYPQNYINAVKDVYMCYSDAENMADFINENIPKGSTIIFASRRMSNVVANTKKDDYIFWDLFTDAPHTFTLLSEKAVVRFSLFQDMESKYLMRLELEEKVDGYKAEEINIFDDFQKYSNKYFEKGEKVYIVDMKVHEPIYDNDKKSKGYRKKVYSTSEEILLDESFVIYEMIVE